MRTAAEWLKEVHPDTLRVMKEALQSRGPGHAYYVYVNEDLGSYHVGHLKFLMIGPEMTYQTPPDRLPDTARDINWRYMLACKDPLPIEV